jgi:hypothetical protein
VVTAKASRPATSSHRRPGSPRRRRLGRGRSGRSAPRRPRSRSRAPTDSSARSASPSSSDRATSRIPSRDIPRRYSGPLTTIAACRSAVGANTPQPQANSARSPGRRAVSNRRPGGDGRPAHARSSACERTWVALGRSIPSASRAVVDLPRVMMTASTAGTPWVCGGELPLRVSDRDELALSPAPMSSARKSAATASTSRGDSAESLRLCALLTEPDVELRGELARLASLGHWSPSRPRPRPVQGVWVTRVQVRSTGVERT